MVQSTVSMYKDVLRVATLYMHGPMNVWGSSPANSTCIWLPTCRWQWSEDDPHLCISHILLLGNFGCLSPSLQDTLGLQVPRAQDCQSQGVSPARVLVRRLQRRIPHDILLVSHIGLGAWLIELDSRQLCNLYQPSAVLNTSTYGFSWLSPCQYCEYYLHCKEFLQRWRRAEFLLAASPRNVAISIMT